MKSALNKIAAWDLSSLKLKQCPPSDGRREKKGHLRLGEHQGGPLVGDDPHQEKDHQKTNAAGDATK